MPAARVASRSRSSLYWPQFAGWATATSSAGALARRWSGPRQRAAPRRAATRGDHGEPPTRIGMGSPRRRLNTCRTMRSGSTSARRAAASPVTTPPLARTATRVGIAADRSPRVRISAPDRAAIAAAVKVVPRSIPSIQSPIPLPAPSPETAVRSTAPSGFSHGVEEGPLDLAEQVASVSLAPSAIAHIEGIDRLRAQRSTRAERMSRSRSARARVMRCSSPTESGAATSMTVAAAETSSSKATPVRAGVAATGGGGRRCGPCRRGGPAGRVARRRPCRGRRGSGPRGSRGRSWARPRKRASATPASSE